jgi:RES domain-containing protein
MYYQIGAGDLYRVTRPDTVWPAPVQGLGAFYTPRGGSRYNRIHQLTVSCSEDPLVAITEAAFSQALKWREAIASSLVHAVTYPLRSEHLFWAFQINPRPPVIDLEHTNAIATFGYSPHVVTNPSENYRATQDIADAVRSHSPPVGSPDPLPEGVQAPSARTPKEGVYQPKQLALFVMNKDPIVPFDQGSQLSAKMMLEFEFFAAPPVHGPVDYQSLAINWTKPKFRLTAITGEPSLSPVPALAGRPGGNAIPANRWRAVTICF